MKKFTLTELQAQKLATARVNAAEVLREIKSQRLSGPALDNMGLLEDAVAELEMVCLAGSKRGAKR